MKPILALCGLSFVLITGCAPEIGSFYWADYSSTLYDLKKEPGEKSLKAHKEQLLLIITDSPKKGRKIPPGIQAEYGYLLLREGKETEGWEYLEKEKTQYPESMVFIQRLQKTMERGKGK